MPYKEQDKSIDLEKKKFFKEAEIAKVKQVSRHLLCSNI